MNSRNKGKIGEREFASLLRENGFDARRGQQFSGGADSPDVVSDALSFLHFEVKRVQNLNLADACVQAQCDCGGKPWVVAHRRNHAPWFITMKAEFFFELIREFQPQKGTEGAKDLAPQIDPGCPLTPSLSPDGGEGDQKISAATCVAANSKTETEQTKQQQQQV